MRTKYVLLLAAFIAIACATVARAEIPTIQADTVFQGFGGGSVSGIVFGPTGETVILMHDAQPVEINIKTKQIVREFEKVPNALIEGRGLFIVQGKGWVCCNIQSSELNGIQGFYGLVIWDYNTGLIINSKQPAITSNGKQFYTQLRNNDLHKQYFCRYDINSLRVIDSVEFDQGWFQGSQTRFSAGFGIIPNSNKLIIGVNNKYSNGDAKRSTLYALDFETKLYTEIPIPFENSQNSSFIGDIKISETGKYFIVQISIGYLFYDNECKFLFKETAEHLQNISGDYNKNLTHWVPYFIHDDNLLSIVESYSSTNQDFYYYLDFYNIAEKIIKKRILLDNSSDIAVYNNDIAILFKSGKVALIKYDALPVVETAKTNLERTAEFQNGNIIINSEISEPVDIEVLDYKGNVLYSKKGLNIIQGNNSIPIDLLLSNGIYFFLMKVKSGNYSYKFLVSR